MSSYATVTQLSSLALDASGHLMPVPDAASIIKIEVVDFSVAHAESSAFDSGAKVIMITANAAAQMTYGDAPNAAAPATPGLLIPAGLPIYFGVASGKKISLVAATA
jgi:hypothetical protein